MTGISEQCKKVDIGYGIIAYINAIGDYHNPSGPAIVYPDHETLGKGRVEYFINGMRHREDGPAVIGYEKFGNVKYYKNDNLHNENGPAKVFTRYHNDGSKLVDEEWYIDNIRHREDGPASVETLFDKDGNEIGRTEIYYFSGKRFSDVESFEEYVKEFNKSIESEE